jgi:uncharacterized membrane protein
MNNFWFKPLLNFIFFVSFILIYAFFPNTWNLVFMVISAFVFGLSLPSEEELKRRTEKEFRS